MQLPDLCLSMVDSCHGKENQEISCTKGEYEEWLAFHKVSSWQKYVYLYMLGTTTKLSSGAFKFLGFVVSSTYTFEKNTLLRLRSNCNRE